jgi:hypothetical protein
VRVHGPGSFLRTPTCTRKVPGYELAFVEPTRTIDTAIESRTLIRTQPGREAQPRHDLSSSRSSRLRHWPITGHGLVLSGIMGRSCPPFVIDAVPAEPQRRQERFGIINPPQCL